MKHIRNFSIIAHMDSMDIERERGISIKAQSVTLNYKANDGETYQLNFIDTPGHVDFTYEVSRSLAACEGALLVVDAGQGVEAQTLANCYTAIEMNLEVIPVLNKIDLPQADPLRVAEEIEDIIGIDALDAVQCSAKTGVGIAEVLEMIVKDVPPPVGDKDKPLQALIIDSWFDPYQGVVSLVRIKHGELRTGDKIKIMSNEHIHTADQVGVFTPKQTNTGILRTGEVGFVIAGIKEIHGAPVGDTITHQKNAAPERLPGFQKIKPQVYAGMFPIASDEYESFRDALNKLSLNDASLFFEPENSTALGFGFRCGFLGMLHMEIIQERLEREYDIDLITTAPTVIYEVVTKEGTIQIDNPSDLPAVNDILEIREPVVEANILVPQEYLGSVITLCIEKRGMQTKMNYHGKQVAVTYELPMAEVVMDFFDKLKSTSRGFASLDYNFKHFQTSDMVRVDILINGERVDALAIIVHRDSAQSRGRQLADALKELIPRQMFDIAIQAAIGAHVIARTTVKQLRKNVIAKCYGGDVSRKKKLLQKQKDGKKRMKQLGNVEVPQEAFLAILKVGK